MLTKPEAEIKVGIEIKGMISQRQSWGHGQRQCSQRTTHAVSQIAKNVNFRLAHIIDNTAVILSLTV